MGLAVGSAFHREEIGASAGRHDLQAFEPCIIEQRLTGRLGHEVADVAQEEEFTAEGGDAAAFMEDGGRIGEHVLLLSETGTELAHHVIAEELADEGEDEEIEYIDVDEADIEDLEDFEYEDEEN